MHTTKRPLVKCKGNNPRINCPCCNDNPHTFKRLSNRAVRRDGRNQIRKELEEQ